MENILLLDTSVGSLNKGDDIIMKCVKHQLKDLTMDSFVLTLPTHVSPFQWFQVLRRSNRVKIYSNAKYKFVGGTNLLTMDMLTHFPQWNINLFNYSPLKDSILLGVGAGKGDKVGIYTKMLYKKVLSKDYIHSVRDERTKKILEGMGFRAYNTGCPTLWSLTPNHCKEIKQTKSDNVIFTLTHHSKDYYRDQILIDTLKNNYKNIHFWIQDAKDLSYLNELQNIEGINIVPPDLENFEKCLSSDIDYVGTRLHGGIYAMRKKIRSIIISIDERARGMEESYNLNIIERKNIQGLEGLINSEIKTNVNVNFEIVNKWLNQFN